jgi:hypothetical protein
MRRDNRIPRMSALQKGCFYREGVKDTRIFKYQVQDLHHFPNGFEFPSCDYQYPSRASSLRGDEFVFSVDSRIGTEKNSRNPCMSACAVRRHVCVNPWQKNVGT